jgi:hypothetical protein
MKLYISDHNRVLASLRKHPDVEETSLVSADAAVVWQDYRDLNRDIIMFCNAMGMPTLVMQHGGYQTTDYVPPTRDNPDHFPLFASRAMLWGVAEKERMLAAGYDPQRMIVTGCSIFDDLPVRKAHSGVNVVFFPIKWGVEIHENYTILKALLEMGRYRVITKLVKNSFEEKEYAKLHEQYGGEMVVTSLDSPGHIQSINNLLEVADVIILPWETTASLFAYCMDIPLIFTNVMEPRTFLGSRVKCDFLASAGGLVVNDLKDLPAAVDYFVEHPEFMREDRLKTAAQYANFGAGGKAVDKVVSTIKAAIESAPGDSVKNACYARLNPADAAALSEKIIEDFDFKGERAFRTYAQGLRSENAYTVMESVTGFPGDYVLADIPAGTDYGVLAFSAEHTVSTLIGKQAKRMRLEHMNGRVAPGAVSIVFDTNYPRSMSELETKAEQYERVLKPGGELHMYLRNPGGLRTRVKAAVMDNAPRPGAGQCPGLKQVHECLVRAGFRRVSVEGIHPKKLYLSSESAAVNKKLRILGAFYHALYKLLPVNLANNFILVYKKQR